MTRRRGAARLRNVGPVAAPDIRRGTSVAAWQRRIPHRQSVIGMSTKEREMKLMMRVLGSTATVLLVAAGISTSCSKSSKEPETPSEEQQQMREQKAGGAMTDGSTAAPSPSGGEQSFQGEGQRYGGQQYQGQEPYQGQQQYGGSMQATIPESSEVAARSEVHALSTARCERESRCNNIGSGRKYESMDECTQKLDARGYDDLGPSQCKSGIRREKLDTCLSAIRTEGCGAPPDTLTRLVSCRSAALCGD